MADPDVLPRHARVSRRQAWTRAAATVVVAASMIGVLVAAAAALTPDASPSAVAPPRVAAPHVTALPVPAVSAAAAKAPCDDPAVTQALAEGTDADVIAAFGGGADFRSAVAGGAAPCIDLSEAARVWVVVDKRRPLDPIDYEPTTTRPADMPRTADARLRAETSAALEELVRKAAAEGAGSIGLNSGYRSYASQQRIHEGYVGQLGRAAADLQSARPGYSEHQTGLATDVIACDGACGSLEGFGGTAQSDWVEDNAWRFGFIVRYEKGRTDVTGYEWEPWHLRYIGPDLAQAYRDGDFHTLEEFFGLPSAPDYAG